LLCDSFQFEALTKKENIRENEEAIRLRDKGVTTCGHHGWTYFMKKLHNKFGQLPADKRPLYRLWLLTKPPREGEEPLYVEDLPKKVCEGGTHLRADLFLPYPSGPHWERLLADSQYKSIHGEKLQTEEELDEQVAYYAQCMYRRDARPSPSHPRLRTLCYAMLCGIVNNDSVDSILNSAADTVAALSAVDDEAVTTVASAMSATSAWCHALQAKGIVPDPKSVVDALMQDDSMEWAKSLQKEFDGLNEQGVFSHNHTLADLRAKGIRGKPIPCRVALTYKYNDGWLDKLKSRICLAGHKGNVVKGIHYNDVFAAAPVEHTVRILCAMLVIFHLYRRAWDIKMAYTWAPLPEGEKVAVIYPEGFKRPPLPALVPGGPLQELFMILEKNLYGMPSAGRGWSLHRNKFVEWRFNPGTGLADSGEWTCHRCIADPCLFIIDKIVDPDKRTKPRDPRHGLTDESDIINNNVRMCLNLPDNIERSWVLVHTDDCDGYGTSDEVLLLIMDIMHKEWTAEEIDSSYVLGIKRDINISDPERWTCTMTMTPYVENMVDVWREELIADFGPNWENKVRKTSFPDGLKLNKELETTPEEVKHNLKRGPGYQSLVGSLLWAVRHCFPICLAGCSSLCKMMSCPSDKAFRAGLHMLIYMYQHRHEGIRFTETSSNMRAYVDASNDPDPNDGKCRYGFGVFLAGPIITKSSKLTCVGLNSTYNEYQALTHCIKHIVWVRKLMLEMKLGHLIEQACPVLADNAQANNLCHEDIVTKGNMYFDAAFHYNKERVKAGDINVLYVNTNSNVADPLTKGLGPIKEEQFREPLCGYDPRVFEAPLSKHGGNKWELT